MKRERERGEREREANGRYTRSLANVLPPSPSPCVTVCLFSLSSSLCSSLSRGQTDTRDRPETRIFNKQSVYRIACAAVAAPTDGYLFSESSSCYSIVHTINQTNALMDQLGTVSVNNKAAIHSDPSPIFQ